MYVCICVNVHTATCVYNTHPSLVENKLARISMKISNSNLKNINNVMKTNRVFDFMAQFR